MSKLTDMALAKIEDLQKRLSEAETRLAQREAQLFVASEALAAIQARGLQGETATASSRIPQAEALLQEVKVAVRRQTAQECVALIYPDGNPEIAIRRIKQDFGLVEVSERG